GDARAIRQDAAAQQARLAARRDAGERLADQTRFSDARVTHEREEMRAPVGPDALEGVEEQAQLTLPSDELRAHRREAARLLGHGAARPHGAERGDRIR